MMSDWITEDALAILVVGWMISNVVSKYLGRVESILGALVSELRELRKKTPAPIENNSMSGLEAVEDTLISLDRSVSEIKEVVDFFRQVTMHKMVNEAGFSVKEVPEGDQDV